MKSDTDWLLPFQVVVPTVAVVVAVAVVDVVVVVVLVVEVSDIFAIVNDNSCYLNISSLAGVVSTTVVAVAVAVVAENAAQWNDPVKLLPSSLIWLLLVYLL